MIRILIPLDGSSAAEEALNHACAISKTFPAELTLLKVIADSENDAIVRKDSVDFALSRHQAQSYLDGLVNRYGGEGVVIGSEIAEGHPAETIVQIMTKTKPDLLVLTRYGSGNAQRFAAGGTAQKIVSRATCSVLLIDPRRVMNDTKSYQRILVPVSAGKDSDCTVAVATMIAEIQGAELFLLHVNEEPRIPNGLPDTRHAHKLISEIGRIIRREAERRLHELAAKIPKSIHVTTRALVASDISFAIESTAEDCNSDLLLMHKVDVGSGGRRQYGSVNESLIQYSHRPLFILQPSAGEGLASNFRSVYLDQEHLQAG
jgi:nucleotide-binding universal stress UspA family protein